MTLLKGLKILDFSTLLPGPFATLILSDLGADVIHVTRPTDNEPWIVDEYLNRSKKKIAFDLKKAESIEYIKEMVMEYDIVLEQFRPNVMKRLGLGYEQLKEINPSLIYCSLTGFGQYGPYHTRPGHDINYVAMSGIASYSGSKQYGPPNVGTQIADLAGGSLYSVIGILSAVIYRNRTGEGQYLDISMTDCTFTLNAVSAPLFFKEGTELEPEEMLLNGGTFYGYYKTKDKRYFSVGSLEPTFRKNLCEAIGRPELFELSMSSKRNDVQSFKSILTHIFLEKTFEEWNDIFSDVEACVEPVLTFAEAVNHPLMKKRGMVVEVPMPEGGFQKRIACPIKSTAFVPKYDCIKD